MGQEMEDWQTTFAAEVEAVLVKTQYTIRLIYGDDNLIYLLLLIGTNYNRVFRKDLFVTLSLLRIRIHLWIRIQREIKTLLRWIRMFYRLNPAF